MWKNANHGISIAKLNIITPNWLRVDKATIFLKSHSVLALRPAISVVDVETININILKLFTECRNG